MAKIFYSSSTNSDPASNMKELILNKKDNILDIDDYSKPYILEKILNTINDSNIFVCDITPNNTQDYSPNVMIELGYAINKLGLSNILIIYHKTDNFKKHNISMLDGIEYITYDDFNDCDVEMIIGKIEEIEKKYTIDKTDKLRYDLLDHKLSERSYNILATILDVRRNENFLDVNPQYKDWFKEVRATIKNYETEEFFFRDRSLPDPPNEVPKTIEN